MFIKIRKMFGLKLFGLLLLTSTTNSLFSQDLNKFINPRTFAQHLHSLTSRNESRFISSNCLKHLIHYAKSLLNLELWAMQFFDASEKLPAGMFKGNGAGLGSFDQCLELNHEISGSPVHGKYCLGSFVLADLNQVGYKDFSKPSPRMLNVANDKVSLAWGVCLPDSCSAADFQIVTLKLFKYSELMCQTLQSQDKKMDAGDYSAIVVTSIFCSLFVFSTIFHYLYRKKGNFLFWKNKFLSDDGHWNYFSLITTVNYITEKSRGEEIRCLDGMRCITLFFMIVSMKFIMYPLSVLTNWVDILQWILNKNALMVLEGIISIDTFFLMSGMLVSYNYLIRKQKGRKFNILLFYLNRIIRLTPALGFMVLISATLMRHYGSGPIWPYIQHLFIVDSCRKYWWSSLLYIQNYVNPGFTDVCLLQTWYLSIDMQLFILSPLLLIPLGRWPKYTIRFTVVLLFCSIVSPFIATWVYDLKALLVFNINPVKLDNYLKHYFFPLHTRASSWLIGFLFGCLLFESKKGSNRSFMKKMFSRVVVTILWVISIGLLCMCITISQAYIGEEYNWLTNAFHFALVRPAWCVAVAWIIFACEHGYSGPINSMLSANMFRTTSRLTYSTFLVFLTVVFAITQQTRRGHTFSIFAIMSTMWADVVWSLILGFALAVIIEKPLIIGFKDICRRLDLGYRKKDTTAPMA